MVNYFEWFELPVSFMVDQEELKRRFYANSKQYHPDFHTLADSDRQAEMLEKSSFNNQAFRTLQDDDRRIRYVLQFHGRLADEAQQPAMSPDFLMDMMDINEQLMALEMDGDTGLYQEITRSVDQREAALRQNIRPVLENWTPAQPEGLDAIQDYYLKKRYLLRIRENLSKFAPS